VQDTAKNGVFEYVGKIAGVEFVMIVQSRPAPREAPWPASLSPVSWRAIIPRFYLPRTAGMAILSSRQLRRAISAQS
jgi:hypothetical protein